MGASESGRDGPLVVITEFMHPRGTEILAVKLPTHHDESLFGRRDDLFEMLANARALIVRNRTQVDAELLAHAPHLKAVGRLGVGLDNIDMRACAARGVSVHPATGTNTSSVAEYVIGAALLLVRAPAMRATEQTLAGDWPRQQAVGGELNGKKLGLVGFGAIARAVAQLGVAFNMTVAAHDPFVPAADPAWRNAERQPDLDGLLARSDVLSLHIPLTGKTRGLLDARRISRCKPGMLLINTSRGGIVDEKALACALKDGRLGGAALDVFANEPASAGELSHFAGISNVLLSPHVAGITEESSLRTALKVARAVLGALAQSSPKS